MLVAGAKLPEVAYTQIGRFAQAIREGEKSCILVLDCPEPSARIVLADLATGDIVADTKNGSNIAIVDGIGLEPDETRAIEAVARLDASSGKEKLIELIRSLDRESRDEQR